MCSCVLFIVADCWDSCLADMSHGQYCLLRIWTLVSQVCAGHSFANVCGLCLARFALIDQLRHFFFFSCQLSSKSYTVYRGPQMSMLSSYVTITLKSVSAELAVDCSTVTFAFEHFVLSWWLGQTVPEKAKPLNIHLFDDSTYLTHCHMFRDFFPLYLLCCLTDNFMHWKYGCSLLVVNHSFEHCLHK